MILVIWVAREKHQPPRRARAGALIAEMRSPPRERVRAAHHRPTPPHRSSARAGLSPRARRRRQRPRGRRQVAGDDHGRQSGRQVDIPTECRRRPADDAVRHVRRRRGVHDRARGLRPASSSVRIVDRRTAEGTREPVRAQSSTDPRAGPRGCRRRVRCSCARRPPGGRPSQTVPVLLQTQGCRARARHPRRLRPDGHTGSAWSPPRCAGRRTPTNRDDRPSRRPTALRARRPRVRGRTRIPQRAWRLRWRKQSAQSVRRSTAPAETGVTARSTRAGGSNNSPGPSGAVASLRNSLLLWLPTGTAHVPRRIGESQGAGSHLDRRRRRRTDPQARSGRRDGRERPSIMQPAHRQAPRTTPPAPDRSDNTERRRPLLCSPCGCGRPVRGSVVCRSGRSRQASMTRNRPRRGRVGWAGCATGIAGLRCFLLVLERRVRLGVVRDWSLWVSGGRSGALIRGGGCCRRVDEIWVSRHECGQCHPIPSACSSCGR
jgi:hypothetical protein